MKNYLKNSSLLILGVAVLSVSYLGSLGAVELKVGGCEMKETAVLVDKANSILGSAFTCCEEKSCPIGYCRDCFGPYTWPATGVPRYYKWSDWEAGYYCKSYIGLGNCCMTDPLQVCSSTVKEYYDSGCSNLSGNSGPRCKAESCESNGSTSCP